MAKRDLYRISGHWDHYLDGMFVLGDPKDETKECFALRPMTCPFQYQVYLNKPRSYRELPMRLTETSTLFRNEDSGEMHGLIRVRQFTISEGHYILRPDQLEEEVKRGHFLGLKPYLTNCPPYLPSSEIRIFDFLPPEHLEVADRNGWIVMLHIPRSKRLCDPVNLAQIMEIEEKYKNLKLIVAHIGRAYAKEDIGNAFDLLKNTKNLVFDFTANVCDDAIRACIEAVGTRRLLFGSDLPIAYMRMYRIVENGVYYNVVPRGLYGDVSGEAHMRETDEKDVTLMIYEQILAFKRCAAELKLTEGQVEDVMFRNAKRLIESVH